MGGLLALLTDILPPRRMTSSCAGAVLFLLLAGAAPAAAAPAVPATARPPTPIVFVGEGWTAELRRTVAEAEERLPPRARAFPGGPLELELHAQPGPFGMGTTLEAIAPEAAKAAPALPEWTAGRRRFHLYGFVEPVEPRALFRLEKLSAEDRERLWRQRAVIHAILQRWDDALHWSRREAWKQLDGWLAPFDRFMTLKAEALNRYDWAYSRRRGMESAALDLITFAEEALVPPEDFAADPVPPDDRLECQEFSKLHFLEGLLVGLGGQPIPRPRCPAFEKWAAPDSIDHFEVIFSAPSGVNAESLFGHVLLRPVHTRSTQARGPDFEPVLEIAAVTNVADGIGSHLWKGLTGGYLTIFATSTLAHQLKQNVEVEHRNLRRFRLNLTPEQTVRLAQRSWELERRGYLAYYFLTENCAAELLWLINGVLDEGHYAERPGTMWIMPTASLDELARVRVKDAQGRQVPLLTHLPDDYLSHQSLAAEAERKRHALLASIEEQVPELLRERWQQLGGALDSRDPVRRRGAYDALEDLVQATLTSGGGSDGVAPLPSSEGLRGQLFGVLKATERIERYSAERATRTREQLDRQRAIVPQGLHLPTAEELIAERQRSFEHERPEERARIDLRRVVKLKALLDDLPRRPFTPAEAAQLPELAAAQEAFVRWTQVEGDLLERHFADIATPATEALAEVAHVEAVERDERGLRGSGFGFLSYGFGAETIGSGQTVPTLQLHTALVRERLGDQRMRGFSSSAEVRLLEFRTDLRLSPGWPTLQRMEASLIRFRTLGREPEILRKRFSDLIGFGAGIDMYRESAPQLYQFGRGGLSAYLLLDASPQCERFTAIGLGAAGDIPFEWYPLGLSLGPTVELVHRTPLPGRSTNALRFEASYTPQWTLLGGTLGARQDELRAVAEAELVIGEIDFREQAIGPRVEFLESNGPHGHFRRLTVGIQWSWL